MEWVVALFYLLIPILIVGFVLYAIYHVTMDVSAIRARSRPLHRRIPPN